MIGPTIGPGTRGEMGKLYFKMKNFCVSKSTIKEVKAQPTEWESILENCVSNKKFTPRI